MKNNTYQGFTNRETWSILLWMFNDERSYNSMCEFVQRFGHCQSIQDMLRCFIVDRFPNGTPEMKGKEDLNTVNWEEVANTILESVE